MDTSKAQIVATIGPATKDEETIQQLIERQMGVARLNFSWGTYEEHTHYIETIRVAAAEVGKSIPIIQDLSGPRLSDEKGHYFDEEALEVITEKDLRDLDFGISKNVEYITLSYVGNAHDVEKIRGEIKKRNGSAKVIAKVEREEAVKNIDEIVASADAIMIGRGDLGQSIPLEQIPFVQYMITDRCKKAGKPVITATEMLLSMIENEKPTRAEVTDVAFAILLGSDAVMLSEETARGKYPIHAVEMMAKIIREAENNMPEYKLNSL